MEHDLESAAGGTAPENTDVIPEAVHTFYREDGKILGYLVIDSRIQGLSVGGIRMVPEMPLADLCHLARAMTLKYSFLKWPLGGAKAAVLTHGADLSGPDRARYIASFAERLAPFRGRYLPGEDAGTTTEDLTLVRRTARFERIGRVPDSAFYTALTVRICVEQLAREQRRPLSQCTVAIEGFGKVGGWVARHLGELGCRIVAVSTKNGAVYRREGLDVDRLVQARESAGDDCLDACAAPYRIEREHLLTLPVDWLIPCALSWSIRRANAAEIRARSLVCGANNAVSERAKEILAARGIAYFPDFVSNCGGVLGSMIEMLCRDQDQAVRLLREQFEPRVESLLTQAGRTGRSPEAVARDVAAANHQEMKQRQATAKSRFSTLLAQAYRRGLLPRHLVRLCAAAYLRRMMA